MMSESRPTQLSPRGIGLIAIGAAAVLFGASAAGRLWWTGDDAFISFRCARNLVEGHGLVFNAGERVEAHTNFLWTLWVAAGLKLGFSAENWANAWGLGFYLACIALLAIHQQATCRTQGRARWSPPLAALGAALHHDWAAYATGGLETSFFTFLLLCGFLAVVWGAPGRIAVASAGLLLSAASLTRPDGLVPALVVGLFLLAGRRRTEAGSIYAAAFASIWLPVMIWRCVYYGELVPNSYYAKSAGLAWYGQGWRYLQLYLERYGAIFLGPVALVLGRVFPVGGAVERPKEGDRLIRRQIVLAAAIGVSYTLFVVRVGGDFMFARMLIPVTPFFLILLEAALKRWLGTRPLAIGLAAGSVLATIQLLPPPVTGPTLRYGIANEPQHYGGEVTGYIDRSASVLGAYFEGLPVRVAFYGTEARLVYKARFPVAIEGETALTDPAVARQPLTRRKRVGHEKPPSARYLILERRADFAFSRAPREAIDLFDHIPDIRVKFNEEVYGQVLHWNPELLEALVQRGAVVQDFPSALDAYISRIDEVPTETVARDFERFELFYFDQVDDPRRRGVFLRRLGAR